MALIGRSIVRTLEGRSNNDADAFAEDMFPDDIGWLFETPLECSVACNHGLGTGRLSLQRKLPPNWRRDNWQWGGPKLAPIVGSESPSSFFIIDQHPSQPTQSQWGCSFGASIHSIQESAF